MIRRKEKSPGAGILRILLAGAEGIAILGALFEIAMVR
jgi:hypothetical protein